ncbi:cytochrome c [Gluconacetobacter johannae DSM 13595]|uniref:C-type cytochrome n=1 Tax=Gluconacetobacter johannae TaxID=112140 RepID=A0A7W4P6G4_9PROT|nr:c-type cytochrome [Gluconacetobacter johannae]MBB2177223.1 c-type cytochrome [Gluconacetobacter johannae]GBQ81826.1 cytochrome c [Gluconacetobacter johannae DSM 13595]
MVAALAATGAARSSAVTPAAFTNLVLHGDVPRGQALADAMCSDCHVFERDGVATIGPSLYGLMGTHVAMVPDYNFSPALLARKRDVWSIETLSAWLKNPAAFAPGTRMGFDGVDSDRDRADIIAYLRSLSPGPESAPASATPAR